METVTRELLAEGVGVRPLTVSHAFHSPLMDPMLDEFEAAARAITYRAPRLAWVSNVTGALAPADEPVDAGYWRRHLRAPVRFGDGLQALRAQGCRVFVEVGPGSVLSAMGARGMGAGDTVWTPSMRSGQDERAVMVETAARLYVNGVSLDWAAMYTGQSPRRLAGLPTYPYERTRHWVPTRARLDAARTPWDAALATGRTQSRHGPLDLAVDTYADRWACLGRLTTAYIARAMRELGVFERAGEAWDTDALCDRLEIPATHRQLIRAPAWRGSPRKVCSSATATAS